MKGSTFHTTVPEHARNVEFHMEAGAGMRTVIVLVIGFDTLYIARVLGMVCMLPSS